MSPIAHPCNSFLSQSSSAQCPPKSDRCMAFPNPTLWLRIIMMSKIGKAACATFAIEWRCPIWLVCLAATNLVDGVFFVRLSDPYCRRNSLSIRVMISSVASSLLYERMGFSGSYSSALLTCGLIYLDIFRAFVL
jgi:hypothetical protein